MLSKRIFSVVLLSGLTAAPLANGQNPVNEALQGAANGAAQSLQQSATDSLNKAMGTPNAQPNGGQNSFSQTRSGEIPNAQFQTNGQLQNGGRGLIGNAQQQNANGQLNSSRQPNMQAQSSQSFSNQFRQNLSNSLNQDPNGYRVNGAINDDMARYGYRQGDVLLDQNGQPIRSQEQLDQLLQNANGSMQVRRNDQVVRLNQTANPNMPQPNGNQRRLGITMQSSNNSVIVADVTQGSVAANAGIKQGDQIVSINGQQIQNPNNVSDRINNAESGTIVFEVQRQGTRQKLTANFGNSYDQRQQTGQASNELETRIIELERQVKDLQSQLSRLQKNVDNANRDN